MLKRMVEMLADRLNRFERNQNLKVRMDARKWKMF